MDFATANRDRVARWKDEPELEDECGLPIDYQKLGDLRMRVESDDWNGLIIRDPVDLKRPDHDS